MPQRVRRGAAGCHAAAGRFVGAPVTAAHPFRAPPIHYGWVILAAGAFGSFMTMPGQTAGVSVFFDPISVDLGISRSGASVAYATGTLAVSQQVVNLWFVQRREIAAAAASLGLAAGSSRSPRSLRAAQPRQDRWRSTTRAGYESETLTYRSSGPPVRLSRPADTRTADAVGRAIAHTPSAK